MKKIGFVILCIFSFTCHELLLAQDLDEFDLQGKGGLDGKCDCAENFKFGTTNFNIVNDQIAIAAGIQAAVYSAWLNTQELLIFNELEELYRRDFFNFHDASKEVLKDNAANQGSYWKNHLDSEDYPKYYDSKENKRLNLVELQHLQIRRNEIQSGNIDNSVFSFSMVDGEFLKDIKDISKLNALQDKIADYYEVNANTEFIADEFRGKINRFDNIGFASHMKTRTDKYWDKDLENSFLEKIFNPNREREDRVYVSQFYTNMYMLSRTIHGDRYKEYEDSNRKIIRDMPKGRSENVLGFVWENMPTFDFNLEDLLGSFTEEDILADLALIGLGEDNNDFLNDRQGLRNEILEYYKANDISEVSRNAMHYLLNEYRAGRNFVVDYSVFDTSQPSIFSDASNPERALEFCFDSDARDHGLPNFGNVLGAFFDYVEDDDFEGYIIRNIFDNRGIAVPSGVPNSWYGEYFNFVPHVDGCIKINFDNGNDSFTAKWFLDKDKDGYHAKGSTPREQTTSPGSGWVPGISKGEDCNDDPITGKDVHKLNKCNKCEPKPADGKCRDCIEDNTDNIYNIAPSTGELSQLGVDLLKGIETLRLLPYNDQTGKTITEFVDGATIGYGHLIVTKEEFVKFKDGITESRAETIFKKDIERELKPVRNLTHDLNQNQFDALVILVFNIGAPQFRTSSLRKFLEDCNSSTNFSTVEEAWKAFNKSQKKISQGLINRRNSEWNIFVNGEYKRW